MKRVFPFLLLAVAWAVHASAARETWRAMALLPALLVAPGWAPARWWAGRTGSGWIEAAFLAFWFSVPVAMVGWAASRFLGGGGVPGLAVATLAVVAGLRAPAPALPISRREGVGIASALVCLLAWFGTHAGDVARPLDRYWYLPGVPDRLPETGRALAPIEGWAEVTPIGEPAAGCLRLRPAASLTTVGGGSVPQVFAIRGPVGAEVRGLPGGPLRIEASPTEDPVEGPVWRYLDAGVAARWVETAPDTEPWTLTFNQPEASTVFLLPSTDALWTIHGWGELRYAHYYQLLNMVEQLRWARERWVTDVQPPLWTWVLGPALAATSGEQPTTNVLFTGVLGLVVLGLLRAMRTFAPEAPWAAWTLPGLAAAVIGRLILEPGSSGMPDTLYGVAMLAALTGPLAPFGLLAQLLRYPGGVVVGIGALFLGQWRELRTLVLITLATALFFALGGAVTGHLDGWLRTVAWEGGPEHWHGQTSPAALLARAPEFYESWLIYGGGTPLLAALAWSKGTRVFLGTGLLYSLLLCTIDHSPTHYFVPLILFSTAAVACSAAAVRRRELGEGLAILAAIGLAAFWRWGEIRG